MTVQKDPLHLAFLADRAQLEAAHPPISKENRCRYCGRLWQRFVGTSFDGHVTCAVSLAFMQSLVEVLDAGASYAVVGERVGVSPNVVRAWWHHAKGSPQGSRRFERLA